MTLHLWRQILSDRMCNVCLHNNSPSSGASVMNITPYMSKSGAAKVLNVRPPKILTYQEIKQTVLPALQHLQLYWVGYRKEAKWHVTNFKKTMHGRSPTQHTGDQSPSWTPSNHFPRESPPRSDIVAYSKTTWSTASFRPRPPFSGRCSRCKRLRAPTRNTAYFSIVIALPGPEARKENCNRNRSSKLPGHWPPPKHRRLNQVID